MLFEMDGGARYRSQVSGEIRFNMSLLYAAIRCQRSAISRWPSVSNDRLNVRIFNL